MHNESITIERVADATEIVVSSINYLITQLGPDNSIFTKEDLESILADSNTYLFIAKDMSTDTIVGTLTLIAYQTPTGRRGYIEDVVVDSNSRGKGIGKSLVNTAIQQAKDLDLEFVALTSRPERDIANKLYIGLGFQKKDTNFYRYITQNSDQSS
jgi:ribosomal protein S18 acetylase RimI-like enzyme